MCPIHPLVLKQVISLQAEEILWLKERLTLISDSTHLSTSSTNPDEPPDSSPQHRSQGLTAAP